MMSTVLHLLVLAPAGLVAQAVNGDSSWLLLLGPVGAGATYFIVHRYYRNTDRSHDFERETRVTAQPVTGDDVKVKEVRGTRNPRIQGENSFAHRQRVRRG
jgi:hypothetical protein